MTQPRTPIGGRYSLERPLLSSPSEHHWIAIEVSSGRLVVVEICEAARMSSLAPARGLTHRHLAAVIDLVRDLPADAFPERVEIPSGAGVVVAEHVPGVTLRKTLEDGPLHSAKAVAWVLRLADAVQALHAVGAIHGAISPRSVLAGAEGRPIAPVLSHFMVPPLGAYCPPERLRGAPQATSDDVWALYATLYAALAGKPAFSGATREALLRSMGSRPAPLSSHGVAEPALQEIISRGLASDRRVRATDIAELIAILDGWERDPKMLPPAVPPPRGSPKGLGEIVSGAAFGPARDDGILINDASLPDDQGRSADVPDDELATMIARPALVAALQAASPPADAPPAVAPAAPKRPSFNPFARKASAAPWLAGGALFLLALAYFALASGTNTQPESAAATTGSTPAVPRVASRPAAPQDPGARRDECVVAHFAPESFEGRPDFSFVCQAGDFRETAKRLHGMVTEPLLVDAGTDAAIPDSGPVLSADVVRGARGASAATLTRLGWYELPATAIIRRTCCPEAEPVVLPNTPGNCEQLQAAVRRLADESAKSVDLGPAARSFDKAVGCLLVQRTRHGYAYEKPPTPANRAHFQRFLGSAAILSARR